MQNGILFIIILVTGVALLVLTSKSSADDAVAKERCTVGQGHMVVIHEHRKCVKSIEYIDVSK